jgi:hypothetical protein
MKHKHILKNAPVPGKIYRVVLKENELYDARILEYEGGCWAKIEVENILPSDNSHLYQRGQKFDLKLGYYSLYEIIDDPTPSEEINS